MRQRFIERHHSTRAEFHQVTAAARRQQRGPIMLSPSDKHMEPVAPPPSLPPKPRRKSSGLHFENTLFPPPTSRGPLSSPGGGTRDRVAALYPWDDSHCIPSS